MNKTKTSQVADEKALVEAEDEDEGLEDLEKEEAARIKIERCIERCRALYRSPLISDATRRMYEADVFSYMRDQATVEEAKLNIGWLNDTLVKAAQAREWYEAKLSSAVANEWISGESATRWKAKFNDPDLIEWQREKWIKDEFPAYCARWKKVAEDRKDLLERAALFEINVSDEPDLAVLKSKSAFLGMKYDARKELVTRIDALLIAIVMRKKDSYKELRDALAAASQGSEAYADPGIAAKWLKEAVSKDNPSAYFASVLVPRLDERRALRSAFDDLQRTLAASRVPDGLRLPSLGHFLKWSPDACASYLAEADNRLAAARREEAAQEALLDADKKRVRSSMDSGDWKGSETALAALIAGHADDAELKDMRRYLELHRPKADPKEDPESVALVRDINTIVSHVPGSMQELYRAALKRGSVSFAKVMGHMYMAVWRADQQGHPVPSVPERDGLAVMPRDAAAGVKRVTAEGREEADAEDHAEQEQPAVLSIADDAQSQMKALDILEKQDAAAHASQVNGVVSESVTLKQQRYLVDHVNRDLMGKLRALEERGVAFAMAA